MKIALYQSQGEIYTVVASGFKVSSEGLSPEIGIPIRSPIQVLTEAAIA